MKIVLTFAVKSEFASWRRLAGFQRLHGAGASVYRAQRTGAELYTVITGIGARDVKEDLRKLFEMPVDVCIVTGLAGSLRRQHPVGAILVAKVTTTGTTAAAGSHDGLVDTAIQCGATVVESFYTSNRVVNSSREKLHLGKVADAVEMESFHVMTAALRAGIPAVAVRAISDPVEKNLPLDFNRVVDKYGNIRWMPALSELAKAPARLPQLLRFGLDGSRAARNLAQFLNKYVTILAAGGLSALQLDRMEMK